MLLFVATALLAVFVVYCVRWRLRTINLFKQYNIPGPSPHFLWGNVWDIVEHGHLVMQKRWHKQYGPVVGYYLGMIPVVIISDPELLKLIQLKDFHKFVDRAALFADIFGFENNLLVLKGQRWRDVRASLSPSFTTRKLKQINPMMCACVDKFMENVDEDFIKSPESECVIYNCYRALTLDTICRIGMGLDLKIQNDCQNSKYLKEIESMMPVENSVVSAFCVAFPIILEVFGRLAMAMHRRISCFGGDPINVWAKQCSDIVKLRRAYPGKYRRADLLQLMIEAASEPTSDAKSSKARGVTDEIQAAESKRTAERENARTESLPTGKSRGLTDKEVIDNAILALLAGYETTSSSLGFLTKMLLRFPEVQERVRAELLEATDGGQAFDFERLQRCQYTEAFIQETLRMCPPVYFLTSRISSEDVKYGSLTIPKGVGVYSSVVELHYDERVFHDARDFRPERFLPENRTPAMLSSYQPFGAGPRNCIGMRFAQMEIKITLAKLLTKYRISSPDEPKHDPLIRTVEMSILQRMRDPLKCRLELLQTSKQRIV